MISNGLSYRKRKKILAQQSGRRSMLGVRAKAISSKPVTRRMRWNEIIDRFSGWQSVINGVELGAYRGHNAEKLLHNLPTLQLTCIDTWGEIQLSDGSAYTDFNLSQWQTVRNEFDRRTASNAGRLSVLQQPTAQTDNAPDAVDFVFIDADHSYEGCAADIAAWWPRVKPGGWLCGHDYGERPKGQEQYNKPGVTRAVNEFIASSGLVAEFGADGTWLVQNPTKCPVVVWFWDDNKEIGGYYEASARALKQSLDRLKMQHDILAVKRIHAADKLEGRARWLACAAHKINVISKAMRKHGAVIYVDCDYIFDRRPIIPENCDIAAVAYRNDKPVRYRPRHHAGFMYFADTPKARQFVKEWRRIIKTAQETDDHIAFDIAAKQYEIHTLPSEYCWRGELTDGQIYGRLRKRVRDTKLDETAKLVTVYFGNEIQPLVDAHINSIRANVPNVEHICVMPPIPEQPQGCTRPRWSLPNYYKLKFWRDLVKENMGGNIILLDADTLLLKDPRVRFDQDKSFDLCFTDRVDRKHPINAGVIFVRCNERTAAFFDTWCDYDERVFTDSNYFAQAQQVAYGQNQASLGMQLKENATCGCNITYVPCAEWNSVNSCWPSFEYDKTYILHVKNGGLREYALTAQERNNVTSTNAACIRAWNLWCNPGYMRQGSFGAREAQA